MTQARSQAELVTLRKRAQDMAASRKERVTSVHLLAAVAASEGAAGALLRERRLDEDVLLKASRAFDDDGPDPIGRVLAAARQVAMRRLWYGAESAPPPASAGRNAHARPSAPRSPSPEPTALHLLLAILADRSAAAHRSLVHAGVDLARLRTSAMQIALGVVATRRRAEPSRGPAGHEGEAEPRRAAAHPSPAPPPARAPCAPPRPAQHPAAGLRPRRRRAHLPRGDPGPASPRAAACRPASPAPPSPRSSPPPRLARPSPPRASPSTAPASRRSLRRARTSPSPPPREGSTRWSAAKLEIDRVLDVLARRHANSPCLVGPPGVGKTAVARGLAHRLAELDGAGDAPPRVLIELSLAELVAAGRRAMAERIAALRAELGDAGGRIILFVDELHELFVPGVLDDVAAEVKLGLARGELRLVGATTTEEYRRSVEVDCGLARRFTPVEIEEPDEPAAFLLLRSVAEGLGRHHGLVYGDEVVAATVAWSIRYLPGRALPDKAIAVLDLAGARARRKAAAEEPAPRTAGPRREGARARSARSASPTSPPWWPRSPTSRWSASSRPTATACWGSRTCSPSASSATARPSRASPASSAATPPACAAAAPSAPSSCSAPPASARPRPPRRSRRRSSTRPTR